MELKQQSLGQIAIIGNGSWGTALAKILTDNGNQLDWWVRNEAAVEYINRRGHNPNYLTAVHFASNSIRPSISLAEVLDRATTLVFAVPSAFAQQVIESIPSEKWQHKQIISAIKGILPESNLLLNDYLTQNVGYDLNKYVAITGPCHAEEVADERLSYLTFSGLNDKWTAQVAQAFSCDYINTTSNHDIWGAQFAAVLKNVYAIGAGMAHGLGYGDNFLSVYITNCYREMYQYLVAHFNKVHPSNIQPDFHTSAYLGDLLVTGYSLHSRNRAFGTMLGKGYSVKSAILEMNMVAEGYYASRGMQSISRNYVIDIPLATCIYEVLWEGIEPEDAFRQIEKMLS
ncbi:MAG: NAD(P)-binding domain-containing protein [Bacteroidetes bacterium]|nr:NAD(P)-binding domain-containing protein [Bacteroidota bacterium]MBS1740255.1 NAD(P)-binding domain-containing protein [Bacteroidota bacterium]MBS1776812.1 NAD(P)-binding domain-containing protein [Bacteroidota bacterium]